MNSKIIKILVITVTLFILFPFFQYYILSGDKVEKFTNSADYGNCRSTGYTKEFCLENPLPNQCLCPNGNIGILKKGFKGKCICGENINGQTNVYFESNYDHNMVKAYNA
jgi:hypothetical protein